MERTAPQSCRTGETWKEGRLVVEGWDNKAQIISELYAKYPCGRDKLYDRVRQTYAKITREDVARWLRGSENASRYVRPKKRKVVRPITSNMPKDRFQADLITMSSIKYNNRHKAFILVVIDHFSKRVWAWPIAKKDAATIVAKFRELFEAGHVCAILQTDNGTEFKNELMTDLCEEFGVLQVFGSAYSPQSQGCVERFNQTLGRMISKRAALEGTRTWVDFLDELVGEYNRTNHSSIGMSPNEAYGGATVRKGRKVKAADVEWPVFNVGDKVRVRVIKPQKQGVLLKPMWSKSVYEVEFGKGAVAGGNAWYYLKSEDGLITRQYHARDLLLVGDGVQ